MESESHFQTQPSGLKLTLPRLSKCLAGFLSVVFIFLSGILIGSKLPPNYPTEYSTLNESPTPQVTQSQSKTINFDADKSIFPDILLPLGASLKTINKSYKFVYNQDPGDQTLIDTWDAYLKSLGATLISEKSIDWDVTKNYLLDNNDLDLKFGAEFGECPDCPSTQRLAWTKLEVNLPKDLNLLSSYNLNIPLRDLRAEYTFDFSLENGLTEKEILDFYDFNLNLIEWGEKSASSKSFISFDKNQPLNLCLKKFEVNKFSNIKECHESVRIIPGKIIPLQIQHEIKLIF